MAMAALKAQQAGAGMQNSALALQQQANLQQAQMAQSKALLARQICNPGGMAMPTLRLLLSNPLVQATMSSAAQALQALPTLPTMRDSTEYDAGLLFGEVGWLIGELPDSSDYDDEFLRIADNMESNISLARYDAVSLLTRLETDGITVNWDACKPLVVEPQSLWTRVMSAIKTLLRKIGLRH